MRPVTYSLTVSLDGYAMDPGGGIDWAAPDPEVFRFAIDQIREVGVHLMGRRLYEAMRYWDTVDPGSLDDAEREWTDLWTALPKVVFSRTLASVEGSNTRLASGTVAEEVERLRAEPGDGDIAIGGPTLAAEVAALGLINEYRPKTYPVLLGGGTPFFPQRGEKVALELVESRRFRSQLVYSRYRAARG